MRKFLNDIGVKDKDLPWRWNTKDERQKEWAKERKEYGFDERDTWTLRYTLTLLTYERLKYYRDFAPVEMDKIGHAHEFDFEDKTIVFGVAIDRVLRAFEIYLKCDGLPDEEMEREFQKCWALLGVLMPGLWW